MENYPLSNQGSKENEPKKLQYSHSKAVFFASFTVPLVFYY